MWGRRRREFSILSFPFGHFVMTESVVDRGAYSVPPRSSSLTATHTFVPLCGFYFFLLLSSFLFPFVFSFFPLTQKTRAVFPRGRIILLLPISVAGALCAFYSGKKHLGVFLDYVLGMCVASIFLPLPMFACPVISLAFPDSRKPFYTTLFFCLLEALNEIAYLPKPIFKWLLARRSVF